MQAQFFDTITRSAAQAAGRRAILAGSGAGLLTAIGGPVTGAKKKKKNKAKKKCNQQKSACEDSVAEFCAAATDNPADEQECIDEISPCCAQCNVDFGVSCLLDILST